MYEKIEATPLQENGSEEERTPENGKVEPPAPSPLADKVLAVWDDDLLGEEFDEEDLSDAVRVGQLLWFVAGINGNISNATFFIPDEAERLKTAKAIHAKPIDVALKRAYLAPPSEDIDNDLSLIAYHLKQLQKAIGRAE